MRQSSRYLQNFAYAYSTALGPHQNIKYQKEKIVKSLDNVRKSKILKQKNTLGSWVYNRKTHDSSAAINALNGIKSEQKVGFEGNT